VGPTAGVDVCEKSLPPPGFFFMFRFCSYLVLHCSGIGLFNVLCVSYFVVVGL
jgi:hypothetical protein